MINLKTLTLKIASEEVSDGTITSLSELYEIFDFYITEKIVSEKELEAIFHNFSKKEKEDGADSTSSFSKHSIVRVDANV